MAGRLAVIGAPSSAGAYGPGQERAPAALREAGLLDRLAAGGVDVVDAGDVPAFRWRPDRARPFAQNLEHVLATARAVAGRVEAALAAGDTALVLGGDCTVELGTVAGAVAAGRSPGLVYVDMHPDLNVPSAVPDGALDWMGMAHLLGVAGAEPALTAVGPREPLLTPDRVVLLGADPRAFTAFERRRVDELALDVIEAAEVRRDPAGAGRRAAAALAGRCDTLLVHLDVDVMDFTDLPLSQNTGRNVGLTADDALAALGGVLHEAPLGALTLTELNPLNGAEDGSDLARLADALAAILARSLRAPARQGDHA